MGGVMPKWKIKRNALVQSLFGGFCFINFAVVSLIMDGMEENPVPLGAIALALISVLVTAADPKARHHTDSRVCFDLMLHLFATGITLWISFHWIIVVLNFLELALCIYFWRKK